MTTLVWKREPDVTLEFIPRRSDASHGEWKVIHIVCIAERQYVARLERVQGGAVERHTRGGFTTVAAAERWCERAVAFAEADADE